MDKIPICMKTFMDKVVHTCKKDMNFVTNYWYKFLKRESNSSNITSNDTINDTTNITTNITTNDTTNDTTNVTTNVTTNNKIIFLKIYVLIEGLFMGFLLDSIRSDHDYVKDNFDYFNQSTKLGITLYEYVFIFRIYTIIFVLLFFLLIFLLLRMTKSKKIFAKILKIFLIFRNISVIFYLILNIIGMIIYFKYNDNTYCSRPSIFDDSCSQELYNYLSITLILRTLLNCLFPTAFFLYYYLNFNFNIESLRAILFENKENNINDNENVINNDIENNVNNVNNDIENNENVINNDIENNVDNDIENNVIKL